MGIFKRCVKKVSNDLQSLDVNVVTEQVEDTLEYNGIPTNVVSVRKVDVRTLPVLPTNDELDLEEQLKAGVKPEFVNPHGMLDPGIYDASADFNKLVESVESKSVQSKSNVEVNE